MPRSGWLLRTAFVGLGVAVLIGQAVSITFDEDDPGKPPKAFVFALTGQGKPGVWVIRKDDAAHGNVLVQTDGDTTDYRFPVAVYNGFTGTDVTLSVSFKAISGQGIRGRGSCGGIETRTTTTSHVAMRSRTTAPSTTS